MALHNGLVRRILGYKYFCLGKHHSENSGEDLLNVMLHTEIQKVQIKWTLPSFIALVLFYYTLVKMMILC